MAAFCPNLSDPQVKSDFESIKRAFNENIAYYFWDRYQGDMFAISEAMKSFPLPKTPTFEGKEPVSGEGGYTSRGPRINIDVHPTSDRNNGNVWDVEKKYKTTFIRTVNGKRMKYWKSYSESEARKLKRELLNQYMNIKVKLVEAYDGGTAVVIEGYPEMYDEVFARQQKALEKEARIYREKLNEETREDLLPDPLQHNSWPETKVVSDPELELSVIRGTVNMIRSGKSAKEVLEFIKESGSVTNPRTANLVEFLEQHIEKNPYLTISTIKRYKVPEGYQNSYMYFDPEDHNIYLVEEAMDNHASFEYFSHALLHEYTHGFTSKAIRNPETKAEQDFSKEITRLYNLALKHTKKPKLYGYTNEKEFVSEMFTNPEFYNDVKSIPYNAFWRFIQAIVNLFRSDIKVGPRIDEQTIKTVMEFISSTEDFVDLTADKTDISQMPLQEHITKVAKEGDVNKREEFVKLIRGFEEYKKTRTSLTGVTDIISEYGLGIDQQELEGNETLQEAVERANAIGNVMHGTLESILSHHTARIKNDLGITGSVNLRKDLGDILARFEGENVTIMTEVYLPDTRKGLVGRIDMVVIDSKGKIHLYDFKSKEKGFDTWAIRIRSRADGGLKYSDKQRALAQLSIYRNMWEAMTNTMVASMNVVRLVPEVREEVSKDKKTGEEIRTPVQVMGAKLDGIDTIKVPTDKGQEIYDAIRNKNAEEESYMSSVRSPNNPKKSFHTEQELKRFRAESFERSKEDTVLSNLIDALEKQLQSSRKNISEAQEIERKLDQVKREEDPLKALDELLHFARVQVADINKVYFQMVEKGEKVSIGRLFAWKDAVSAFDGFGDYANYLANQTPLKKDKKHRAEYEKFQSRLDSLMQDISRIKYRYEEEGIKKLADFLLPYYNGIKAEIIYEARRSYRLKSPSEKKEITEEEHVRKIIEESGENIDVRTRVLLEKELRHASRDIGSLGMWIDNLLDSKDPVIAAMVKAFAKTEFNSHNQALNTRDRILKQLRQLERVIGDNMGTVAYEKLYDFLLEKDAKGKYTGFFITAFSSKLWTEYNDFIKETRDLPEKERLEARREWKNERTDLNKEAFAAGKQEFLKGLFEKGDITSHQWDLINEQEREFVKALSENLDSTESFLTLRDLANQGLIDYDVINQIDKWVYKNAWGYRSIKEAYKKEYENPQWQELLKEKETNSPKWQFYELMMKLMEEANDNLPYASRIGNRMPGVRKRTTEMIKSGQKLTTVVKESFKNTFDIMPDDIERTNFDKDGNPKYFLPIHYTKAIDDVDQQSFDVPTIVYKFWESANSFQNKLQILPEMELAKHLINTRKTDIVRKETGRQRKRKKKQNKEEFVANNANLGRQLNEWFMTCVYGMPKKRAGTVAGFDVGKMADILGKYTSLSLLGVNLIQGTANALLGEVLQVAERFAGEYMSKSAYRKGSLMYMENIPGIIGDVGRRGARNIVTVLMEKFDILDEWEGSNFSKRQKYRMAMTTNALFFTTHAGEHELQGRFLLSMLSDKKAYDKDGNELGSMLDMYAKADAQYKKDLRKTYKERWGDHYEPALRLPDKVDAKMSEWTPDDIFEFGYKVRGILSRLHGEYSDLGRVALQREAAGRLAFMFRKFVVPGWKRRMGKRDYVERLGDFVEGNYRTTTRFFGQLVSDIIDAKFALSNVKTWKALDDHEKANIRRAMTEAAFLAVAMIVSTVAIQKIKDIDDDEMDERMWSLMAYQALRLRAELLFFINPKDTLSILRSPTAAMTVFDNVFKIISQLTSEPLERYEKGPWKGHLKIEKQLTNFIPGYRQWYRIRDQRQQISWFTTRIN